MTVSEIVRQTGYVPEKFETSEGHKFELEVKKYVYGTGYVAVLWILRYDQILDHIFTYAYGLTPDDAKENLRIKILSEEEKMYQ